MDSALRTKLDALAINNDATYPDSASDPSVKVHQQDHDVLTEAAQALAADGDTLQTAVQSAQDTANAAQEEAESHTHTAPHAAARVVIAFTQSAPSTPPLTDFMPRPSVADYKVIYGLYDNPEGVLDADADDLIYKADGGSW